MFLKFALRVVLVLALVSTESLQAADPASSETKLRESLRATMLQLRTAQNEEAALQAAKAESDQKIKILTAQVEKLTKEAAAAEKSSNDQGAELLKYKESVEKWETAYNQASQVASGKETERAKLAAQAIDLQRRTAELQTKNRALFKTANEILTRYERFSLGEALAAKEPFTGITRVKLENLVQDYQDKLAEQRAKP